MVSFQSKHFGFGFPSVGAGYGYQYNYPSYPSYGFNAYQGYHGGYNNAGHYYGGHGYVPQVPVYGGGYHPYYRNNKQE